ncbi:MAG: EAL domain-containing protein [Ferrovibrio sp.]|uniref:bifunctional diguanylate cyclase/phosphodiesterase n=1 Tax=Ferrovibrio sp. TaxID=1917215 RepID=UPI00262ECE8E|nr:EAL domain-containing protein [Ferrovibrio sp.]MCW0236512.1 EAL domain-containing protein [Ferrovibrio sp.]
MHAYSIRWILILLVLIAVVPGVIGTSFEIASSFQLQRQNALESAQNAAGAAAQRVANFIGNSEVIVRTAAEIPDAASLDRGRCQTTLSQLMQVLPRYANLVAVDAEGWLVCSGVPASDDTPRRIDPTYYFDRMKRDGRLTVGYPSSSSFVTGRRIVGISQPLFGSQRELRGALVLAVDLLRFSLEMPANVRLRYFLLAGNGAVVTTNYQPQDLVASQPALSPFFDLMPGAERQLIDVPGPDGAMYLVAKAAVPGYDWTMIAAIAKQDALSEAYRQLWRSSAIHAGILLLGISLSFWLSRQIAVPIKDMVETIMRIQKGLRVRFTERGPLEILALARQANIALDEAQQRDKLLHIADQRLAFAIEANQDGVWDWDIVSGRVDYSERWLSMLGYGPGEIEASLDGLRHLVHPDDDPMVKAAVETHLAGQSPHFTTEHRMRHKNGHYIWVLNRGAIVDRDDDGSPIRMVGTHTDIDNRKAAEFNLLKAGVVFDKSPQAIIVTDEKNIIQLVNPAFERVTGYMGGEAIGRNPSFLASGRQMPDFYKAMWQQLIETGEWHGEIWNRRKDGAAYCEWLTITQMRHGDQITGHIGMFIDITQRKEAEAQVEWRANFDTLTMLPNRHLLLDRIDQAVKRNRRGGSGGAVMLLDLDHFKEINDSLGHQAGDAVLIEVARRLQKVMRENDTVGRLGGDEFVILLTDLPTEQASAVAERILQALAVPVTLPGRDLQTGASIGIAIYPDDSDDPSELLRLADMAMYSAKAAGRGSWQMFTQQMDLQSRRRLDLIADMRVALMQDQIELFYQPVVSIATGEVVKAEGLARWRHPRQGFIPPDQFIPLAEETGLIHQLGQIVLTAGMAARQRINDAGLNCQISVNISSRQIGSPTFAAEVRRLLVNSNMATNPIIFEVTESLLLSDFERACALLREFADAGAVIALDDFGTGYSSLSYLYRLPASILKIDRSFTINLGQRSDVRRLMQAIIDLGHDLGFKIVAEGVETAEQRDALLEMGCDYGQGYYFAKPMPFDDLMALLVGNSRLSIPA